MSEETQTASEVQNLDEGTSQEGQSNQSHGDAEGVPNDPQAFQADYTRKYQALSQERQQLEQERAQIQAQRQQLQQMQGQGYNQGQPQNYNQQPTYGQNNQTEQELIDQFGYEGAQTILRREQNSQQQLNQLKYEFLYNQEVTKGMQKYGAESWSKHDYIDPQTGQTKNKIMDYRLHIHPLTGKSLSLDEAWRLANPTDPMQVKKEAYQEINKKDQATPTQHQRAPVTTSSVKQPQTVREAMRMAREQR